MTKRWEDNFEALLAWLDQDRESAGVKYEEIRHGLVNIFNWRGCSDSEDLADETISRVMRKVSEVAPTYQGDPALYFFGVAKRLLLEVGRRARFKVEKITPEQLRDTAVADDPKEDNEQAHECLEKCLQKLSASDRELILNYYQQEQHTIEYRRQLAQRYGLAPNNLRVKVYRIRAALHDCIQSCLKTRTANETDSLENHD